MTRTDIIQYLINQYNLNSYIEVGTQRKCNNFNKIKCEFKTSVDPDPNSDADHKMTSDEFFKRFDRTIRLSFMIKAMNKIDLFFIDGLHEDEQVTRDINNALALLSPRGFIVVHDCNPPSELVQRVPRPDRSLTKMWYGSVWKAWIKLRSRENLRMCVVNTDCGCGIISYGMQKPLIINDNDLIYNNFSKQREFWLNLISVDEFKNNLI